MRALLFILSFGLTYSSFALSPSFWIAENRSSGGDYDIPTSGLISYWRPKVTLDATDDYGSNNGTLVHDATATTNGFNYDGSGDSVVVGNTSSLSFGNGSSDNSFTFSAWIYLNAINQTIDILSKYIGTDTGAEYIFWIDTGERLNLILYSELANRLHVRGPAFITATTWYHVAATYDASMTATGITMYVDGIEQSLSDIGTGSYSAMSNGNSTVFIGGNTNINRSFNGRLSAVAIYNTDLTSNQVYDIYTTQSGDH